jgi:hypothetical protein
MGGGVAAFEAEAVVACPEDALDAMTFGGWRERGANRRIANSFTSH